ncbi:hypothetical protein [Marisediminicola antarctica]|uniref:Uncharacterized protein n=1 Tax=Marisediminicola antarctica TaxID=674079 RepID=A0A7L5AH17_9MICO|nr:hypothetical protein [Marisediminicola antarctica]QHO69863.1 hypothetical protein BHD05_09635 [Marisediminicola antarctica]
MNKVMNSKWAALPFGVLLVAAVLTGCAEETVVDQAEEEGPVAEALLLGSPVTLQNEVQEVFGPNSFTVGEGDTLIIADGMASDVEEGDEVQITGTVVEFVTVDVEADYGLGFDDDERELVLDYDDTLAVIADDVTPLPE